MATAVALTPFDVGLARYVAQTLIFLPYEREDDVCALATYVNRLAAVHGDALLASLRRFAPATPSGEMDDGVVASPATSVPLPDAASPAFARLAEHAAYALILSCLLCAKAAVKAAHGVPDGKIATWDPSCVAGGRAVHDKAVTADTRVLCSRQFALPQIPRSLVAALESAAAATEARRAAGGFSAKQAATPGSALLPPDLLAALANDLESRLSDAADFAATLPAPAAFSGRRGAAAARAATRKVRRRARLAGSVAFDMRPSSPPPPPVFLRRRKRQPRPTLRRTRPARRRRSASRKRQRNRQLPSLTTTSQSRTPRALCPLRHAWVCARLDARARA